tara:strand:- start:20060 stop:20464 length:405 start_codon:yes stop_codon:yes gene_type:complete
MNKGSWGKVRAFFDVQTDEGFTIKGFKLIEGINGLFVSLPSQKGKDDEYFDTVYVAPEIREELNHVAIQQYGMHDDGDSFGFPQKEDKPNVNTNQKTEGYEATKSNVETKPQEVSFDSSEKKETETFSDDDIPF